MASILRVFPNLDCLNVFEEYIKVNDLLLHKYKCEMLLYFTTQQSQHMLLKHWEKKANQYKDASSKVTGADSHF